MHDLDRTLMELEVDPRSTYEYNPRSSGGYQFASEGPLTEAEEMELAAELLDVKNDQEMEQFLGDLFNKVTKGISDFANSSTGRALGGVLKQVATTALPIAARALGTAIGGPAGMQIGGALGDIGTQLLGGSQPPSPAPASPQAGGIPQQFGNIGQQFGQRFGGQFGAPVGQIAGQLGQQLGNQFGGQFGNIFGAFAPQLANIASQLFGMELEGLSPQDQEFEVARKFVKLAADATKTAQATATQAPPVDVVRNAVTTAAQQHAPGLVPAASRIGLAHRQPVGTTRPFFYSGAHSGVWYRRGNSIVLRGV
jgi:hypothetical protein